MPFKASLGAIVCLAVVSVFLLYFWGRADGSRKRAEIEYEELLKYKRAADEKLDEAGTAQSESKNELANTKRELYRAQIELKAMQEARAKLERDFAGARERESLSHAAETQKLASQQSMEEVKQLVVQLKSRMEDHRPIVGAEAPPCSKAAAAIAVSAANKEQAPGNASVQVPLGVNVEHGLMYVEGSDCSHTLDLYLPQKSDKPLPLIVWIFGGGWSVGDKEDRNPAIPFSGKGYAVACINYRLSGEAKFPAQIEDCKAAVRWLKAHATTYNIDPYHVGVWGAASGGHLAALLGTTGSVKDFDSIGQDRDISSSVQAVCDFYGPTDFLQMASQAPANSAIQHDSSGSPEAGLIGGPVQQNKEKAERANPIKYITRNAAPFLIVHGLNDTMVPVGQSTLLSEALQKAGIDTTIQRIRAGHGGSAFERSDITQMVQSFFEKHLKGTDTKLEPLKDQETAPEFRNRGFPGSKVLRGKLPA